MAILRSVEEMRFEEMKETRAHRLNSIYRREIHKSEQAGFRVEEIVAKARSTDRSAFYTGAKPRFSSYSKQRRLPRWSTV